MLAPDQDFEKKIVGDATKQLNLIGVHHDFHWLLNRILCIEAKITLRQTEGRAPLRRIRDGFVKCRLDHALLVFRR